jgi:predicted dehydrogenase
VSRKFALALSALKGRATVGPIASRDQANAVRMSQSLGLGVPVASYEEAVGDPSVGAVYVSTPPALHEAHARLAIAAGKPVLIEKPLASDANAARRISEAAEAAGVFAMEAMWTRFQPLTLEIARRVRRGDIGDLRGFHGTFLGANLPDPTTSLFARNGGGALLHRGVYPLSLALMFLGPVDEVVARGRIGETGVDEDIVLLLRHRSGALSDIRAGLRSAGSNDCAIWGEAGRIDIAGPVWRPTGAQLVRTQPVAVGRASARRLEAFRESGAGQRLAAFRARVGALAGGQAETLSARFEGNGYGHEALHLMDAAAAGKMVSDVMPLSESIAVLEIADEALRQIGRAS